MIRSLIAILCLGGLGVAPASARDATPFELGQQAARQLRLYEARDLFRQALQERPLAPGVAEHVAWFLYLNGFHDEECRDLLRQAMPTAQEPAAMERAARHIERELGLRDPADEAERNEQLAFHQAMIEKAADGTAEQQGGAFVDAGDFDRGIPLLEQALAADPDNASLALRLARAYVWSKQLPQADAAYAALVARQPDNAALLLEQGQVAAGLGKLERAQALLAAAERARPDDARIVREREGIDAALAARAAPPKEELPVPPSPVEPVKPVEDLGVYQQGERAEKELRLYEARDLFRQAIREQPDNAGRVEHAAWFAFLNGFHDEECRDLLRQAMPRAQEPAAMERAARHVERELGLRPPADDVEKQEKQAFDTIMVEKARRGTAADLGGALVDAGNYQEGIPLLEQSLAADPTNGPLELRLARAYVWAQRQPEADAAFTRLAERHPGNAALLVELAQIAAGREMLARARALLIAAEQARPGDARILLERSRIEARLINRKAALAAVNRMSPVDQRRPLATLARARAEHYRGQFGPARDGYVRALAAAPHLEEAAHGLAECRLRRGEMPGGTAILDSWMPRERSLDWQARTDLFEELTDPRLGAQFATYSNSLGYFEYDFGLDTRFHPWPDLEIRPALVNSLITQKGFSSIDRQGGFIDVLSRPDDRIATSARLGVNGYTNNWATPIGGLSAEVFPTHWLDFGGGAEYFNLLDFQPPFGVGIYDIVTTIGAVGEKISSTQGTLFVRLRPAAGWSVYARTRLASFSDGNLFRDDFAEVAYEFRPGPLRTRASWNYYFLGLREDAPLYQQTPGGPVTPAYYSPAALDVSTWSLEMSGRPRDRFELGGEGHLFHVLENNGLGVGIFLYGKLDLPRPYSSLRLDARYFTQNRGLTRQSNAAGSYDALNFLLSYDRRY
jgi:thioredoxin-like negative regulator of GroEL